MMAVEHADTGALPARSDVEKGQGTPSVDHHCVYTFWSVSFLPTLLYMQSLVCLLRTALGVLASK